MDGGHPGLDLPLDLHPTCATNPVALVVPCHRVTRTDGTLGGYRWGIERKRYLLDKEEAAKPK